MKFTQSRNTLTWNFVYGILSVTPSSLYNLPLLCSNRYKNKYLLSSETYLGLTLRSMKEIRNTARTDK